MNTEASDRVAPRFDRKKVCLYVWLFDFMFSLIDYPLTPPSERTPSNEVEVCLTKFRKNRYVLSTQASV